MQYDSLDDFLKTGRKTIPQGPVALIFAEDAVELDSTLRHHLGLGFKALITFMPEEFEIRPDLSDSIHRISLTCAPRQAVFDAVNRLIDALPGSWIYYGYNAEYLFYPFCETRSIGELLAFHAEERRQSMLGHVIDLYAPDLSANPNGVSCKDAMLDACGYYAHTRHDPSGKPLERQLDMSGGLRWRFEDHIPYERRRIDRISIFKAKKGLTLLPDHSMSDPEYNTHSCPWHHNLTAAICSFRAAKALCASAGTNLDSSRFVWRNSTPFQWSSQQLLDLGLIEPGQWF